MPSPQKWGDYPTFVALAKAEGGFENSTEWLENFSYDDGWRVDHHERLMGDVDGDGDADVVGFGSWGTFVALSNGQNGFSSASVWGTDFQTNRGWSERDHQRTVGDVNGDGKADLIAFGDEGVYVSLSNGAAFESATLWSDDFGVDDGWLTSAHMLEIADVNGDGYDDIVAYNAEAIYVALSNGTQFSDATEWTPGDYLL